jgi:signal transduction histidine kinase
MIDAKQQAELYLDLMGHDINNMHQVALGYLELANSAHGNIEQKELLEKPIEVLQRSARLIKNVQKLQKHRHGIFKTEKIDLLTVLRSLQREFGSVPGKTITLNLNGHEHCYVLANELLHDVFANLVSNAIRHTGDAAEIIVDVDRVNDNGPYYRVIVEDDGPGIPDDAKALIFNRMHKGTARGLGLGLYLVKTLVDSYSGRVWVEDRVIGDHAKGARFVVLLPAVENKIS